LADCRFTAFRQATIHNVQVNSENESVGRSLISAVLGWLLMNLCWRYLFFKDCAESLLVIDQTETVRVGELLDLCFAIFLVYWPDALQLIFVDGAVAILASLQFQFASN
jgi:hypothetical protein